GQQRQVEHGSTRSAPSVCGSVHTIVVNPRKMRNEPAVPYSLTQLSAAEITCLAARVQTTSAADDVTWWRATIAVDGSLRRSHRSTRAAAAGNTAARAVVAAAGRVGLDPAATDVALLSAAAGDAARALVAEAPGIDPCTFFELWRELVPASARVRCSGLLAA
ncbi:MAG: hypothetical protein ACRD0G_08545, partial [Acidimicrobiales bacterium]